MRSEEEYQKALTLISEGVNDCEVGRRLGIPRGTILDWRVASQSGSGGRTDRFNGRRSRERYCFLCTSAVPDRAAYSYLLGIYLGDGCLSKGPGDVYRLRIACDVKYPDIINEIATHITIVGGIETIGFTAQEGCVVVSAYWKHWICHFPQHAPGRKHERLIELAPWQDEIVLGHPKALLRGLIQSDGNRHVNEVTRRLKDGVKRYRYTRYMFTNASEDILGIFSDALDRLGIHWTRTTARDISVARREDVAFLDSFVGPKS